MKPSQYLQGLGGVVPECVWVGVGSGGGGGVDPMHKGRVASCRGELPKGKQFGQWWLARRGEGMDFGVLVSKRPRHIRDSGASHGPLRRHLSEMRILCVAAK
jgi:hypothetical protein